LQYVCAVEMARGYLDYIGTCFTLEGVWLPVRVRGDFIVTRAAINYVRTIAWDKPVGSVWKVDSANLRFFKYCELRLYGVLGS
jgi:hypothetical protein